MRILIAEDEFTSGKYMETILSEFGDCVLVTDGLEAVLAFETAFDEGKPFSLVCMDIMMPNKDGLHATQEIREFERSRGVVHEDEANIVMITALNDPKTVVKAYYSGGATAFLPKPVERKDIVKILNDLRLLY